MRPRAAAAAILILPGLLLATVSRTWAASDCQDAVEQWGLLSREQVQPVQGDGGRGACIPSEAARRSLLDALARTRGLCGDSSNPELQQTRTLLYINHSFISSLSLCQSASSEEAGGGWAAKAAPMPERPKVAAPLPAPAAPPPITGGPRPSVITPAPPKPAVAAAPPAALPPPAAAPKVEAAAPAPAPPCLEISAAAGGFALVNKRCRGYTVLAVVETRAASGESACKGYTVGASLTMRAPTAPRINYECVASQGSCNKDRLGDMFPECDW